MTQTTFEKYWLLVDPWYFLLLSASYIPLTIFHLITNLQLSTFFSPSLFKDAWFATFWSVVGPETRKNAAVRVTPLLSLASGTVLDIGPGSGEWVSVFDKSKITKIYGVEPNRDHHPALRKKIKEAGLEGRYEIVPVGVEDLGVKWVGLGSVDTVVTVQCLCSVDEPRKMMGELYGYLKEGGSWIVYEHVVVYPHQGFFMKKYQGEFDGKLRTRA